MLLGLAHRVCHHFKQSLLYICFFSIDLFHCIKSNVLSCRLPILLWLFVTFIIFHFPIGKKLWGGPSPKTPTELMIVLQRFLTPHFFSSDEEPSFLCPAQAIPVGNMFSFNRCTLGVACKNEGWSFSVPAKINRTKTQTYQGRWAYLMVGSFPLPEILCWLLW